MLLISNQPASLLCLCWRCKFQENFLCNPLLGLLGLCQAFLKPLNKNGNLKACMYIKESLNSPEHTSKDVKYQNFPDPPRTICVMGPTSCICPGPFQSSQQP